MQQLKSIRLENCFRKECRLAYVFSYKRTISYLQLPYFMWFPLEISSPFWGYVKISRAKSTINALKSTKFDNCFRQECRAVCFCSYKVKTLCLQWVWLVWFSLEAAPCRRQFCSWVQNSHIYWAIFQKIWNKKTHIPTRTTTTFRGEL